MRPGGSAVRRLRVAESESTEAQREREEVVGLIFALPRVSEAVYRGVVVSLIARVPRCVMDHRACN